MLYDGAILEQNLQGERCAVECYQQIADFTFGKDYSTYEMAVSILNDELEHDLQDWSADLRIMKENFMKMR